MHIDRKIEPGSSPKHRCFHFIQRPTPRAADGGSLRDLQAFSTLQQFSGLESVFSPAAANANVRRAVILK